jgi:putative endopeptidase
MSAKRGAMVAALSMAVLSVGCRTAPPAAGPAAAATAGTGEAPSIDPSLLDRATSPCDDFYQFACGGWLARFTLPPDKAFYARSFSSIDDRNLEALRAIAERDAAGHLDPRDRYPQKVGDFWAACMDEQGVEARGLADLRAAFGGIDAVADAGALAEEIGALQRQGISPAFDVASQQDGRDATQVIGGISQGGLTLPERDYYLKTDPASAAIQEAYRAYLARMLELAGEPQAQAVADAQAVYGLEHTLAEAHWTNVEMRDPQRTYNRVDLTGLERLAPRFPWPRYLRALGHPDLASWSVTTPRAVEQLDGLLSSVPLSTWRSYLRWRLLSSMAAARALPKAFVEARFAFVSKAFTGAKELEPRWKHCVRATEGALGEAVGQAFVVRTFGEEGKARSRALIAGIEAAMKKDLDAVPWMDDATRQAAHRKLEKVTNKVGYPDRWRDYDALQVDRKSLFRSLLAADAFEVNRDLDKIGKPVDRNEWEMPPPIVNAYYEPPLNEIVFPAGILQPPFFSAAAPDAVNYGAIGMVMGHELTHGFDDEGRQFDAEGNLRDWWTPPVEQEFERRAACVVDQFDGYSVAGGVKLNGKLTLGENIADLGGVKLAFAAYRAATRGQGAGARVAGFTPDQAFFLGFAQAWCEAVRPERERTLAAVDPHSPPSFRVDGPLSNLAEFQEAFSCPAGSKMVRAERCQLW